MTTSARPYSNEVGEGAAWNEGRDIPDSPRPLWEEWYRAGERG